MTNAPAVFDSATVDAARKLLAGALKDPDLIAEALTHPSVEGAANYQRLEFLGDRVLSLVVADILFRRFPGDAEGQLSKRQAQLVRRETLGEIGEDLGLGDLILTAAGRGVESHLVNARVIGDAVEAVIGAIYLESGFDAARAFIETHWRGRLSAGMEPDSKTALQEWAQAHGHGLPEYKLIERSGPDHDPTFRMRVLVHDVGEAKGEGNSKREAQQAAAERLLNRIHQGAKESRNG